MEYRQLGTSDLKVPALSFGAGTFGGQGPLFGAWGTTDAREARRLVDICLEAGITMFDTADVYSAGASEQVLGQAVKGRRDEVLLSTKAGLPMGEGPDDAGTSGSRLIRATEDALRRLGTDRIDLFQLHAFDAATPVEEVLSTLDRLVRAGKIRYVGVSNFAGWQLMKSLAAAEEHGFPRYVAHQVYYSLIGRDYEWELMPLGHDQGVGAMVWSPLGWGRLTGKLRRGQPLPPQSRLHRTADYGPPVEDGHLHDVVDALDEVARETGRSIPQVAINWLLARPTVSSVIVGARDEAQLRQNIGAIGWTLSPEQTARLDAASHRPAPYPYFPYERQEGFARLNPPLIAPATPATPAT
ncbi:aldo/keto reductase [Streptomyces sp. NBC_01351]|uniref:aldo/keto reductase n=1 Tax=Streptomyces sp. NBC_01351 TaxID=2903833 RepID=UPI002E34D6A4|nr:aldo/keto reductase [Streptomyces sp. NBC_01351]